MSIHNNRQEKLPALRQPTRDLNIFQNKAVSLEYATPGTVEARLAQGDGRVACVVGYGNSFAKAGDASLWIETRVLGQDAVYEIWTANKPVTPFHDGLIFGSGNEDVFFGCLSIPFDSATGFSDAVKRAYTGILDFLQRSACPNLLKVWNYFPAIHAVDSGIDRYQSFCVARHEVFVRYDKKAEDSPSACVLGSHSGNLALYFLASRSRGLRIENPRQTSAYKYPKQYGPRSPIFSRATLALDGASQMLLISGTASILGHLTVHPGAVDLQTRETVANIRALIDEACREGFRFAGFENGMALKVYVRHPEHFKVIEGILREEWGAVRDVLFLQADICRTDLLMEIEAVCWSS